MRIISGKFKGRNLAKSDHLEDLRPTTDKNRELLFSILSASKFIKDINFKLEDAVFLDLCCGSGAVGFEAISRGVKKVFFIDNNKIHLELVEKNIKILKAESEARVVFADVKKINKNLFIRNFSADFDLKNSQQDLENNSPNKFSSDVVFANVDFANVVFANVVFDVIFLDPPYREDYQSIIENIIDQSLIGEKTLLIVESKFDDKFNIKNEKNSAKNLLQPNFSHRQLKLLHQRKSSQTIFSFFTL